MSDPTNLEKIRTWIEEQEKDLRDAKDSDGLIVAVALTAVRTTLPRTLAALAEAVSVIDGDCLPGEIDASFERLLDILNGKREEADHD